MNVVLWHDITIVTIVVVHLFLLSMIACHHTIPIDFVISEWKIQTLHIEGSSVGVDDTSPVSVNFSSKCTCNLLTSGDIVFCKGVKLLLILDMEYSIKWRTLFPIVSSRCFSSCEIFFRLISAYKWGYELVDHKKILHT